MWFAEHRFLGDSINASEPITLDSHGASVRATSLTLENGLITTYGEINGFAGDYFGLSNPISSEKNLDAMKTSFQIWFDLLGKSSSGKGKAEAIRKELKGLNDLADKVLQSPHSTGEDLAAVYKKNTFNSALMDDVTKKWNLGASFLELAVANIDHFGSEARLAYNAGHALALDWAAKGDLDKALAINAFADHFLEDSFAAGHMRVPRAEIAEIAKHTPVNIRQFSMIVNFAASVMHDEDGERGLWVESPSGEKWKAFGDGRLPGKDTSAKSTSTNLDQCRKALLQSVKELNIAHKTKEVLEPSKFGVWQHAPILEKISQSEDNQMPLLKIEDGKLYSRRQKSEKYEETTYFMEWVTFYNENFSRVEDQVWSMIKHKLYWS